VATLCAGQPPPGCARRPHDRFRQDRATHRNGGKPTPRPPATGAAGDDGGQHRESTGTGGNPRQRQRTQSRQAPDRRQRQRTEEQADPGGQPQQRLRTESSQAPDLRQRRQRSCADSLEFLFFGKGCRNPLLLLPGAAALCVLAKLAGRGQRKRPSQPTGTPGPQTAATPPPCLPPRRTGREVPGAKAGEGELGAARERLQRLTSGLSGRKRISRQLWNAAMPSYWNYIPRP
jgi:hypothetical protein